MAPRTLAKLQRNHVALTSKLQPACRGGEPSPGGRRVATKTVKFNESGAAKLPNDKPVVYRIKTEGNKTNYVGIAHRGRVQERIREHIHKSGIPGAKVHIEQKPSIREARATERRIIARSKPLYNRQG